MHVMHVIDGLAVGGAERMLVEIANHTCRSDIKTSVCVTRSDITLAKELRTDIPIVVLNRKGRFDPEAFRRIHGMLEIYPRIPSLGEETVNSPQKIGSVVGSLHENDFKESHIE